MESHGPSLMKVLSSPQVVAGQVPTLTRKDTFVLQKKGSFIKAFEAPKLIEEKPPESKKEIGRKKTIEKLRETRIWYPAEHKNNQQEHHRPVVETKAKTHRAHKSQPVQVNDYLESQLPMFHIPLESKTGKLSAQVNKLSEFLDKGMGYDKHNFTSKNYLLEKGAQSRPITPNGIDLPPVNEGSKTSKRASFLVVKAAGSLMRRKSSSLLITARSDA